MARYTFGEVETDRAKEIRDLCALECFRPRSTINYIYKVSHLAIIFERFTGKAISEIDMLQAFEDLGYTIEIRHYGWDAYVNVANNSPAIKKWEREA